MTHFKKILVCAAEQGFLTMRDGSLGLGPIGAMLQENLRSFWFHANVVNRENVFFDSDESLSRSYDLVKNVCSERVPFELAKISQSDSRVEFPEGYHADGTLKAETLTFVSPVASMQSFYDRQTQRRIWWRKMSASPGRYSMTDMQVDDSGEQTVCIRSKYDWEERVLETVTLSENFQSDLTKDQLQVRDGRRRVAAHCVKCSTNLFSMVVNSLCDAYEEAPKHSLFRFHRKIAPYKISFAVTLTNSSSNDDLADLARFLSKRLRDRNITVLNLPSASRNSLEAQFLQYDRLGIPYTVVLNDNSLKNGIVHLRSRDTTLKEQVHISDLTNYAEKIFMNF